MNLFLVLANYLIVLSKSVQAICFAVRVCAPAAGLISLVPLLLVNQLRTLKGLSSVSAVSCFTISAAVFICMVQLIVYGDAAARGDDGSGDDDGGHADWSGVAFNTDAGILTWSGAVNSVIFRYAPSNLVV